MNYQCPVFSYTILTENLTVLVTNLYLLPFEHVFTHNHF